jgi:hypothetical protein
MAAAVQEKEVQELNEDEAVAQQIKMKVSAEG